MTRGFVIIGGVILVAGAGNALAMSASFWACTALFGLTMRNNGGGCGTGPGSRPTYSGNRANVERALVA